MDCGGREGRLGALATADDLGCVSAALDSEFVEVALLRNSPLEIMGGFVACFDEEVPLAVLAPLDKANEFRFLINSVSPILRSSSCVFTGITLFLFAM